MYKRQKLATTGGFLKKGKTTLLLGIEDEKVDEVCDIIKQHSGKRQQKMCIRDRPGRSLIYTWITAYK